MKRDTLERVVPGELGLPLLQDVHDVGLPQKGHYLVVVRWGTKGGTSLTLWERAKRTVVEGGRTTTLTNRHHVLVLTSTGAAEGAGGAGHDGRVGLAGVVHHL